MRLAEHMRAKIGRQGIYLGLDNGADSVYDSLSCDEFSIEPSH